MSIRFYVNFVFFIFLTSNLYAEHVGLKPSFFSLGSAEALTSSVSGTDSLFYNPAGLGWMDFSVRLVGIEETGDSASLKAIDSIVSSENPEDSLTLAKMFERLDSDDPIYARTTVRALDVVLPFIGVSSFIDGEAKSRNILGEDSIQRHEMSLQADAGLIVGLGWSFENFGFGVSYYRMGRSRIVTTPTTEQRDAVIAASLDGSLEESSAPFRDFTHFYYGGADGYNIGMQYRTEPDGYTGIGVAVLNAGGTQFKNNIQFDDPTVDKMEEQILEEVGKYNIALEVPEPIPEIVNVGASFGLTDKRSPLHFVVNIEGSDIAGDFIKEKFAASAKIGFTLPDPIALAASVPVVPLDDKHKHFAHVGLLGVYAFGGIRPDAYGTVGATLALHVGADRIASLFKFELTAMALTPLNDNKEYIEQAGTLYTAGLTLIVK